MCGRVRTCARHHRRLVNAVTHNRGLVLWRITPLIAEWIASPQNLLARCGVISREACALELGCGVSGLISLALANKVRRYVSTDQQYLLKYVRENVGENYEVFAARGVGNARKKSPRTGGNGDGDAMGNILIRPLDWETSSVATLYNDLGVEHLDLLISCDCIYNEALVEALVTTMRDICKLAPDKAKPTICVVAQQLRAPDVLETWLKSFCKYFHVWRIPDEELDEGLKEGSGYVLHIGILKQV